MEEPNWTKQISSEQVCSFFYAFAIIYVVIAVLSFIIAIFLLFRSKSPFHVFLPALINLVITGSIAFITALFHYLICQRALLTKD